MEESKQSRYVKLTKDHEITVQEDIVPGELNLPTQVSFSFSLSNERSNGGNPCLVSGRPKSWSTYFRHWFMNFDALQSLLRKCYECRQPLPESYEPPADEPWMTGIFGCVEDRESCMLIPLKLYLICILHPFTFFHFSLQAWLDCSVLVYYLDAMYKAWGKTLIGLGHAFVMPF